jgi:RimJ/RimL family protein N-acetyltransferase/sugar phosphate isomerase/epimerase
MRKSLHKIGLKLWSDNLYYLDEILRLQRMQLFDYIELYSLPDTFDKFIDFWTKIQTHYIIHASHFGHGVNLAQKENEHHNRKLINEARFFADKLNAEMIIVHPGINGTKEETIRQLLSFGDHRLVIENKPHFGFNKGQICVGAVPSEVKTILQETGLRFCFDVGHSIYAANGLEINPFYNICGFTKLNPIIVHFTDGEWSAINDVHKHYGEGNFPLTDILDLLPQEVFLTNESGKNSKENLSDFEADVAFFKNIIHQERCNKFINVRKANIDDAEKLYNLSMDPVVRAASSNSSDFSYQSHVDWLRACLADQSKMFLVCEIQGEFSGQIRFAIIERTATISISVVDKWRGSGITPLFFNRAVTELKRSRRNVEKIIAIVKNENAISKNFFKKLGFALESSDTIAELKYTLKLDGK